tara:strand:- start:1070 stop:1894 length:825 start_codon:yes stop_codon:yes gene_type:complete
MDMKKTIWKKYNGAIIPDHPPHLIFEKNNHEIKMNLIKKRSFFARWVSDFDSKEESSFWYVINDKPLTIDDYSSSTRSKIRRGLKRFSVRRVNKEEIICNGYDTYTQAYKRYKTIMRPFSKERFLRHLDNLSDQWEFWGVYTKETNVLVAYSQNRVVANQCNYSTIKFHADYLKDYISYALYFTMNNHYLNKKRLKYVNEGTRSILHKTNVQDFLIDKFKFRKAYCKLHIIYHPYISIIIHLLYPARNIFSKSRLPFFQKIGVVLKQEELRRNN